MIGGANKLIDSVRITATRSSDQTLNYSVAMRSASIDRPDSAVNRSTAWLRRLI